MAKTTEGQPPICSSADLPELEKHLFTVIYRGDSRAAMVIRFRGAIYAYLNRCVHMPKPLDCEHCYIFDEAGKHLRCSMHGIHYDPVSGECLSEICSGKKLTALQVEERDGSIYLTDKRAALGLVGNLPG